MAAFDGCRKQQLLRRFVAASIVESSLSLTSLQDATGIHRSKLGRMRLGRHAVAFEEAEIVLNALGKPVRALFLLACLGDDCAISPEGLAYLEQFMNGLPAFIERISELGPALNPKWANGSVQHLAAMIENQAERRREADAFRSPPIS